MTFQIGDRIQNHNTGSANYRRLGVVEKIEGITVHILYDNGTRGEDLYGSSYTIIKQKTFMQKLSNMVKFFLGADEQTLYKAGYIDKELDITDKGQAAMDTVFFQKFKAELVAMAAAEIADEEAAAKKG